MLAEPKGRVDRAPRSPRRSRSPGKPSGSTAQLFVLYALAIGAAATSLLGPLGLDLMVYRTSPTTLNQLLGSDAAVLFVGAPIVLVAAELVGEATRRRPSSPWASACISSTPSRR